MKLSSKPRWRKLAQGKRRGFRLTFGTTRDHEHVSSLKVELLAKECPLTRDTVHRIWAGPGDIAPLAWCVAHKIADPLSHLQVRRYYWHHFGVAITNPTDSVHAGSIYYLSYNFWSLAQTSQFIEGAEVTPDITSQQPLEDSLQGSGMKIRLVTGKNEHVFYIEYQY